MRIKNTIAVFLFLSGFSDVFAQTTPKYSNDFLQIGVGARALGMGSAVVSSDEGAFGLYWNPAVLAHLTQKYSVGAMHAEYFAGIASFDYAAFSYRIDSLSGFGMSFIRLGVDDILNTTNLFDKDGNLDYDRISLFSTSDNAFILSYGKRLPLIGIDVGGSAKIIYRHVGQFAAGYGFGVDIAAKKSFNGWVVGANLKDVTTTFTYWTFNSSKLEIAVGDSVFNVAPSQNVELTLPRLVAGVSRFFKVAGKVTALAEVNLEVTFDGKRHTLIASDPISIDPKVGLEVGYNQLVFMRVGVNNIQEEQDFGGKKSYTFQPNLGMGVRWHDWTLDYALTNIGSVGIGQYSNVFSITYSFNHLNLGNPF
jgi:hypothetical protein